MDNIILKNSRQKDAVFLLSVMLMNIYISNKQNCLTSVEQSMLETHIKSVYKKIYHNEIGWADKYISTFNSFISSDKAISEFVFDVVKSGLYDVSENESAQVTELLLSVEWRMPLIIKGGNKDYLFELKQLINHAMIDLGIL